VKTVQLRIVVLGLSITSSWGNGHATTYRGLVKGLHARGHDVLFLERNQEWYASNRDLPAPPYGRTDLYSCVDELLDRYSGEIRQADLVIVGSYVPEGVLIGRWVTANAEGVTAFYDIDTPVTLSGLEHGKLDYLSVDLIPRYQLYLSFTGGPVLHRLEREYGSPRARALYCSVDPDVYHPVAGEVRWDLGYLGTYSSDRQPALNELLVVPARMWEDGRFVVAGPQYPPDIQWPLNTQRIMHLPPAEHREFFACQKFTLNITRQEMVRTGHSPSVRLFEAAACGTPIISDWWEGLEAFFELGKEILIAHEAEDTLRYLRLTPEIERLEIGHRARQRVLSAHTGAHRAEELEKYTVEALSKRHGSRAGHVTVSCAASENVSRKER
jgi:spore maturation protein CgeB